MDMSEAIEQFQGLLQRIKPEFTNKFLSWIKQSIEDQEETCKQSNDDVILQSIQEDLRESLPITASTETEVVLCPKVGPNADCDPRTTLHVDAFLYDEDVVDELCDEGKMSRNYCTQCGSRDVKPLTFITHSASVPQIKYIFKHLLVDLRNKKVLDVGSRTGAILYGAYLFSEATQIIGVEIDTTFCQLQQKVLEKYSMKDRIQVIHRDVLLCEETLRSADVVILNNVFEFFMPPDLQIKIWRFLSQVLRKAGQIIITNPSIEESLADLQTFIDLPSWLTSVDITGRRDAALTSLFKSQDDSDLDDIHMYTVNG